MFAQKCKSAGLRVLQEEAHAILALQESINDNFVQACKLMLECKGKVILTGVGKSGHIATKIASTLASTGTQSFFVQAGEAAHGDLGMIGANDVVIAISNSGEGSELKILIPLLRRRNIPLIAIVGNIDSSLGKNADVTLCAHVDKEACPLNLAPTSSSTAELVIGDALAVALIEARGFTANDFALSHPGGALGRRLLVSCGDIMRHDLPLVNLDATMQEALMVMTQKGLGMVCVVDAQNIIQGLFTDGDLRRALERDIPLKAAVSLVMTKQPLCVKVDLLAAEALSLMQEKKINGFIVEDEEHRAIGAFNLHDLLRAGIV